MQLYEDPDNKFVAGFIGSPAMNFIKGVVEGDGLRVPSLGNRLIEAPVALPAEGKPVHLGLRPQHLKIAPGKSEIRLDIRERLGGVSYDYLIPPGGEKIIVETRDNAPMKEGITVTLDFETADAMFFDGETGARLR